jgi:hypothetical protein
MQVVFSQLRPTRVAAGSTDGATYVYDLHLDKSKPSIVIPAPEVRGAPPAEFHPGWCSDAENPRCLSQVPKESVGGRPVCAMDFRFP